MGSSVAGGWGGGSIALHWHAEYAKYQVFSAFETDFCTKNKNSPPPIVIGDENVSTMTMDLKRSRSQKLIPAWLKTFFTYFRVTVLIPSDLRLSLKLHFRIRPLPTLQIPGYAPDNGSIVVARIFDWGGLQTTNHMQ